MHNTSSDRPSFLIYDLHTHTCASDGVLTPTELVHRAVARRIGVLAITDHDTICGLAEAHTAIKEGSLPLQLVPGVEISTLWHHLEIHVVGLYIDPEHAQLRALLDQQRQYRQERALEIGRRLEKNRIPDAYAGAKKLAGAAAVTRGHFARYLVELGMFASAGQVFKKYLSKGKPGYVPPAWCALEEAIKGIQAAGGVAVLAHPARYALSAKWLRRLLVDFKQAGGDAIEIAQCQQAPDERKQLARYAQEYDFMGSLGSDFHQPCTWIELGKNLWFPAGVNPVWQNRT